MGFNWIPGNKAATRMRAKVSSIIQQYPVNFAESRPCSFQQKRGSLPYFIHDRYIHIVYTVPSSMSTGMSIYIPVLYSGCACLSYIEWKVFYYGVPVLLRTPVNCRYPVHLSSLDYITGTWYRVAVSRP